MMSLLKLLAVATLVGLCVTLPTPLNVASSQATTLHPVVALPEGTAEDISWEGTLPEEELFLEGDIVIDSEVIPLVEFRNGHSVRNLVADPRLLWPARTVYYQLPSHGGDDDQFRAAVEEALGQIMAVSCVRFIPRPPGQKTYLKLRVTGKGCATKVGYHEGEAQLDLHLGGATCHARGTIQHEFLHALGFWHEHTRPDRDKHVTVVWDNVKSDYKTNFLKRSEMESHNLGLPYDYASVMHYKYTTFAKHRGTPTLEPKIKDAVKVMGQRRGVTWVDIAKLNRLYNCSEEYYKGLDVKGEGAVFGKIVQTRVDKQKFEKDNTKHYQEVNKKYLQEKNRLAEEKQLKEIVLHHSEKASLNYSSKDKNTEQHNGERGLTQEITQLLISGDKTLVFEPLMESGEDNHPHKFKRETGGAKSPPTGHIEMADKLLHNGGHENFEPQKILPELLKGVLNNDNNNERPIVIQFAIYQPVIYRNESKTDNPDEVNNENPFKQPETPDKFATGNGNNSYQRDKQNIARDSNRDHDKFNRNSQDSTRDQDKFNRNSQEYNREQEKYIRNSPDATREQDKYNRNSQDFTRDQVKFNRNSQEYNREQDKYIRNPPDATRDRDNNRNSQDFARNQEKFNRNSQEYNREEDKYNRNSQGYTREEDKYIRNSQYQHEHGDLDSRISSGDEGYHRGYDPYSSQKQYTPLLREPNDKDTAPGKNVMSLTDYSEIDRITPYDRRTEYSSSFQVSQKAGGISKSPLNEYTLPLIRPVAPENTATAFKDHFSTQDYSLKRIASIPKSDFQESPRIPIKDDDYVGDSNREYNRPFQSAETHNDQTADLKKDFIQPPLIPQRRGDEFTSVEKKTNLPRESYTTTRTEEFVTRIPQPIYPVDTDVHIPAIKDSYGPINHETELSGRHTTDDQSHISNSYGTHEKDDHLTKDAHDLIQSGDVARGDYHSSETKPEHLERKDEIPLIHDSESMAGHFTDSKGGSEHSSPTYLSSSFNMNPSKSPIEDIVNDPKIAKPLPAKSREIPLEVGPPKATQPLIGNGDGENVAPNWKGVIENEGPGEKTTSTSSSGSEHFNDVQRLNNPVSTEIPSGLKGSDRDGSDDDVETKQGSRLIRRPDLRTDQDQNDELDKEIRRQKLEKKLLEETVTKIPEKPVIITSTKAKPELQAGKDIIIPRRIQAITKVLAPPSPTSESLPSTTLAPPTPPPPKKPSNPRREVQEDDIEVIDADEDLISKPNISRVNLNPRQALPLNANATVKMNLRRLFRKERN